MCGCSRGRRAWLLWGGVCMVAPEGGACVVAPVGGHAWLLWGGGMCGCLLGGVCVHGCSQAGGHAWLLWGACVVAPRGGAWLLWEGHAWLFPGGGHAWDTMRYGDTINERAVCILLECILVLFLRWNWNKYEEAELRSLSGGYLFCTAIICFKLRGGPTKKVLLLPMLTETYLGWLVSMGDVAGEVVNLRALVAAQQVPTVVTDSAVVFARIVRIVVGGDTCHRGRALPWKTQFSKH